ncbi:hypothetical protein EVA_15326, partial [gut metagenome]
MKRMLVLILALTVFTSVFSGCGA